MEPELDVQGALQRDDLLFIDVRSPEEFARASIAGAVNIPLFDDDQHRELGIIYHRDGEAAARRNALAMVSPRLPALVDQVSAAAGERTPLIYCWRGGLRSLSLCQILNLSGVRSLRLKGGYKAYRRHISRRLQDYRLDSRLLVIHGLTGVGKTAVLEELAARGCPTLDLEGLARHRGSVFGSVGLGRQRSQKDFDGLLLQQLDRLHGSPYLVVEGEGRRIGNIHLPTFLARAMEAGGHILLTAPLPERVRRIVGEYMPAEPSAADLAEIGQAIYSLRWRLGAARTQYLMDKLEQADYEAIAETLCHEYYDRLYGDASPDRYPFIAQIDAADTARAAAQIYALVESMSTEQKAKPHKGVLTR